MATYYIDHTSGNDASAGTSTVTAWKRHPYMTGWTGSYSHAAGDLFIFKGGETWPKECFPMVVAAGGSSGAGYDRYTTDAAWYTGGSWTRPCFDNEYFETSSATVRLNASYIEISNLELKRYNSSVPAGGSGLMYANGRDYILLSNLYVHGWRTTALTDDAHGGLMFYKAAGLTASVVLENSIIENSENSVVGVQNGVAIRQIKTIRNCVIHDVSSAVLFTADIHDNVLYNIGYPTENNRFDPAYHTNCIYLDQGGSVEYRAYNNLIYDISVGSGGIYPVPESGSTHYVYNNVIYGELGQQYCVQVDPDHDASGTGAGVGNVYVYNNTFVIENNNYPAVRAVVRTNKRILSLTNKNNHVIGTGVSVTNASGTTVVTIITSDNLTQTLVEANAEGYEEALLFVPVLGGSTINAGVDLSSVFTTDKLGVTRPEGAAWDISAYEYRPTAPSNLTSIASGSSAIALSWTDNSSNETGFKIERSTDGVTFAQIATVSSGVESYTDTGLVGGVTYYYRVRACNDSGNSAYSNTANDTTAPTPVPIAWGCTGGQTALAGMI